MVNPVHIRRDLIIIRLRDNLNWTCYQLDTKFHDHWRKIIYLILAFAFFDIQVICDYLAPPPHHTTYRDVPMLVWPRWENWSHRDEVVELESAGKLIREYLYIPSKPVTPNRSVSSIPQIECKIDCRECLKSELVKKCCETMVVNRRDSIAVSQTSGVYTDKPPTVTSRTGEILQNCSGWRINTTWPFEITCASLMGTAISSAKTRPGVPISSKVQKSQEDTIHSATSHDDTNASQTSSRAEPINLCLSFTSNRSWALHHCSESRSFSSDVRWPLQIPYDAGSEGVFSGSQDNTENAKSDNSIPGRLWVERNRTSALDKTDTEANAQSGETVEKKLCVSVTSDRSWSIFDCSKRAADGATFQNHLRHEGHTE